MSLYCSLSESVISFHLPPISLPSSPKVASGFSAFTLSRTVLENIMNADMGFFGAFLSLTFLAFLAGASLLLLAGLSALGLRFLALGAEPPPSPSEPPDMSSLAMSLPSSESSSDGSPSSSSSLPIWKSSSSSLPSSSMSGSRATPVGPPGPSCASVRLSMRRFLACAHSNRFAHSIFWMLRNWYSWSFLVRIIKSNVLATARESFPWR
mmetsp:Transcript_39574/g.101165  ORF Transcript_39574/g.101165 Transcript_39574/m.101165 type:complete len:209 (-) Transcript_39574:1377-2003(-)